MGNVPILKDIPRFFESATRETSVSEIAAAGYKHVALDLAGYRAGSTA